MRVAAPAPRINASKANSTKAAPRRTMLARVIRRVSAFTSGGSSGGAACKSVLAKSLEPASLPADLDAVHRRMRVTWSRPLLQSRVFEDLYRFARRVTLLDRDTGEVLYAGRFKALDQPAFAILAEIVTIVTQRYGEARQQCGRRC